MLPKAALQVLSVAQNHLWGVWPQEPVTAWGSPGAAQCCSGAQQPPGGAEHQMHRFPGGHDPRHSHAVGPAQQMQRHGGHSASAVSTFLLSRRGFASDGLPPHSELGMPALSPTMSQVQMLAPRGHFRACCGGHAQMAQCSGSPSLSLMAAACLHAHSTHSDSAKGCWGWSLVRDMQVYVLGTDISSCPLGRGT